MTHRVLGPRFDNYKIKCYRSVKLGGGVIPLCAYFPHTSFCVFPSYPALAWVRSQAILLILTVYPSILKASTSERRNTMTDKMFKLTDKYADLLTEVWDTKIPVVDVSRPYPNVTMFYRDLLNLGTVVYYKSRLWFYSKPYGVGMLHGVWTNSDGEEESVYDFLIDIFNYAGPAVELVFDPRHFIPKETFL